MYRIAVNQYNVVYIVDHNDCSDTSTRDGDGCALNLQTLKRCRENSQNHFLFHAKLSLWTATRQAISISCILYFPKVTWQFLTKILVLYSWELTVTNSKSCINWYIFHQCNNRSIAQTMAFILSTILARAILGKEKYCSCEIFLQQVLRSLTHVPV